MEQHPLKRTPLFLLNNGTKKSIVSPVVCSSITNRISSALAPSFSIFESHDQNRFFTSHCDDENVALGLSPSRPLLYTYYTTAVVVVVIVTLLTPFSLLLEFLRFDLL